MLLVGHRLVLPSLSIQDENVRGPAMHTAADPVFRKSLSFATAVLVSVTRPSRRETRYSEASH